MPGGLAKFEPPNEHLKYAKDNSAIRLLNKHLNRDKFHSRLSLENVTDLLKEETMPAYNSAKPTMPGRKTSMA